MALNLEHEFSHAERPIIPIRVANPSPLAPSILTEALLDTGADVSLLDADLARPLLLAPERFGTLGGVSGSTGPVAWSSVDIRVQGLRDDEGAVELTMGIVPGLSKTAGSLLGRDFFLYFDFALHHDTSRTRRRFYLGRA